MSVGILDFLYVRTTKILYLVEPLVMGTRTWSFFRHFKTFRLHAILLDAAGAVRAHSGKGPGYCYLIGRHITNSWGPNSCVLGQLTGPLVCFYVKLFLPYIFNSVDFWSSMSLIVPDKKLTEENIIKKNWDFLLMVLHKGFHFVHQRILNLINRRHETQVTHME